MKKRHLILSGALVSIASVAQAMEDSFFSTDLPVVISASRLTQSVLTSPSAVTVIDKAMIEASGFVEIADLFRLVPGFQVAHVDGKDIAVTYHGDGWEFPSRLQVLIDGRSTYLPALSTVDWSSIGIDITDIERIEVVRGPAASAYGSNSFSAAINIITISPESADTLTLSARTGNIGERQLLMKYSDSIGDLFYRVTASKRENEGFSNIDDEKDFNNFSFHGQTEINRQDTLDFYLTYANGTTGADFEPGVMPRDRNVKAFSGHVQWQHFLSNNEDLKLNFYHNYRNENDDANTFLLAGVLGVTPAVFQFATGEPDQSVNVGVRTNTTMKTDLDLQYSRVYESGLQYVAGAGIRHDTLKMPFYTGGKDQISDTSYRVNGNVQLPLVDDLTMNIGAIYEHNQITSPRLSPRLSLNWQVSEQQSFRISAARAYRIPSLLEANIDAKLVISNGVIIDRFTIADENLQPEEITSVDFGYLGKMTSLPISWEFRVYKENIQDVIQYVADKTVIDFVDNKVRLLTNVGEYKTYGIEGEISFRPQQNYFVKFQFNRGHNTEKIIKAIKPVQFKSSDEKAPRESYGLLVAIPVNDWQLNLGAYRVDGIRWRGKGDYVDAYTRVDASIIKKFRIGAKQNIKIRLAAQNFTNEYNDFRDNQLFSARYYAEISFIEF
jgi:iron complex outermembrane receptor protein